MAVSSPDWFCSLCQRQFLNQEAIYQHNIAKHHGLSQKLETEIDDEKIALKFSSDEKSNPLVMPFKCSVCCMDFPDAQALEEHNLLTFQPKNIKTILSCEICGKGFSNQRAIDQHSLFCLNNSSKKEETETR
jgi:uncharacterized Zn-finger protein